MKKLSEAVLYQLTLRNFSDEGTLDAAAQRLALIAAAGMDYIYLSPVAQADADADRSHWSLRAINSCCDNEKNPYRISNYYAIDEEYGGEEALRRFIQEANRLGMGVLMDLVYYHCGPHCSLAREHPEYFRHLPDDSIDPGQFNMLVFDYAQPGLRRYMTDNMLYLLRKFDVDGFRCDCGDWIPADFWEDAVQEARAVKPDMIMLNEGHEATHLRQAFQMDYGVFLAEPLRALLLDHTTDMAAIRKTLQAASVRYEPNHWGVCGIENHDIANDACDQRVERVLPHGAMEAAAVLCFTMGGVPFVYNGLEIADTRRHSISTPWIRCLCKPISNPCRPV